jgi:hypothetical protein
MNNATSYVPDWAVIDNNTVEPEKDYRYGFW